jgi:hypothetical protein
MANDEKITRIIKQINKLLLNVLENFETNVIYSILMDLIIILNGEPKQMVILVIRCILNLLNRLK